MLIYLVTITFFVRIIAQEYICSNIAYTLLNNEYCVYYSTGTANWYNARDYCAEDTGWLVSITDASKNALVFAGVTSSSWIGANNIALGFGSPPNYNYVWDHGDTFSYSNWAPGQPTNVGVSAIFIPTGASGKWYDASPTTTLNYICEMAPVLTAIGSDPMCDFIIPSNRMTLRTYGSWECNLGFPIAPSYSACGWTGVTCSGGVVTAISLAGVGTTGVLPTTIYRLMSLTSLDLSNNNFNMNIPSTIGFLSDLVILKLNNNQFHGSLSSSLGGLSSLTVLDISSNIFNGTIPSSLGLLTKLQIFRIISTSLSGTIPTSIGALSFLTELRLNQQPHIYGQIPTQIGYLTKLQVLDLNSNGLRGNGLYGTIPSTLSYCILLTELSLNNNRLAGKIPSEISSLSMTLQILQFQSNFLTGTIPNNFIKLTKLIRFDIHSNSLSGSIPALTLTLTTYLDLHSNRFTGTSPAGFINPYNLGILDLRYNYMQDNSMCKLRSVLGTSYDSPFPAWTCSSKDYAYNLCNSWNNGIVCTNQIITAITLSGTAISYLARRRLTLTEGNADVLDTVRDPHTASLKSPATTSSSPKWDQNESSFVTPMEAAATTEVVTSHRQLTTGITIVINQKSAANIYGFTSPIINLAGIVLSSGGVTIPSASLSFTQSTTLLTHTASMCDGITGGYCSTVNGDPNPTLTITSLTLPDTIIVTNYAGSPNTIISATITVSSNGIEIYKSDFKTSSATFTFLLTSQAYAIKIKQPNFQFAGDVCPTFNLQEVQLFASGVQIPIASLSAVASSISWNHFAAKVIDGDTSTVGEYTQTTECFDNTMTPGCTCGDYNPTVTIFSPIVPDTVIVYNRVDCCQGRITNAIFTVTKNNVIIYHSTFRNSQATYTFSGIPKSGAVVMIDQPNTNSPDTCPIINLYEVQLFVGGVKIPTTSLTITQSSTLLAYSASNCNDNDILTVTDYCSTAECISGTYTPGCSCLDMNPKLTIFSATLPDTVVVYNRVTDASRIVGASITVTYAGLQVYQSMFTLLQSVYTFNGIIFSGYQVTIPSILGVLTGLQRLDISGLALLTGSIPDTIGRLTSLTYLGIQLTGLAGKIPHAIGYLSKLVILKLANNFLTSAPVGLSYRLGSLQSLTYLDLSNNRLTGMIPSTLCNIAGLAYVNTYENSFECYPTCLAAIATTNWGVAPCPSAVYLIHFPGVQRFTGISSSYVFKTSLISPLPQSFTITAWVTTSTPGYILTSGYTGTNNIYCLEMYIGASGMLCVTASGASYGSVFLATCATSGYVATGVRTHVAVVMNVNTLIFYLNGVVQSQSVTATPATHYLTNNFCVGKNYGINSNFFSGSIENLALFQTALMTSQIFSTGFTGSPSGQPTGQPTSLPTARPTVTYRPTFKPSSRPSPKPSGHPTGQPTSQPSGQPTNQPTSQPTSSPSKTSKPTTKPHSSAPTSLPTSSPTWGISPILGGYNVAPNMTYWCRPKHAGSAPNVYQRLEIGFNLTSPMPVQTAVIKNFPVTAFDSLALDGVDDTNLIYSTYFATSGVLKLYVASSTVNAPNINWVNILRRVALKVSNNILPCTYYNDANSIRKVSFYVQDLIGRKSNVITKHVVIRTAYRMYTEDNRIYISDQGDPIMFTPLSPDMRRKKTVQWDYLP